MGIQNKIEINKSTSSYVKESKMPKMQKIHNIYRHLDTTTEDDNIESQNTQNEQRKALKKLREINLLDQKESLSKEEEKKVQMKGHWERILNPLPSSSSSLYENKQPDEECKQKQQARHLLKEKKRQKEKEKQEKINQEKQQREQKQKREREEQQQKQREKEKEEREKEEQQKRQQEEQQKRQQEEQQKRQREEQQKREQKQPKKPSNNLYDLKREFAELLQQYGGNVNRVFRLLSRKYHPDKNSGTKNSIENQQMLSDIRDRYLQ
jgi:hypothetical protein